MMAQKKIFIYENGVYNLSNFVTQKTKLNLLNNKTARCEIVLIYLVSDKRTFCISKRVSCTICVFCNISPEFQLVAFSRRIYLFKVYHNVKKTRLLF